MRRFIIFVLGFLSGVVTVLLLQKRDERYTTTVSPTPQPDRRSRTLEELAPITKTQYFDVTEYNHETLYADYVKTLIEQLVQPGLTEKEAYIAVEELQEHVWDLIQFRQNLATRDSLDRTMKTRLQANGVQEALYGDHGDEGDGDA